MSETVGTKRSLATEIMEIADSHADNMPEGAYLALANACKRVHLLERKLENGGESDSDSDSSPPASDDEAYEETPEEVSACMENFTLTIEEVVRDGAEKFVVTNRRCYNSKWIVHVMRNHNKINSVADASAINIFEHPARYIDPAAVVVLAATDFARQRTRLEDPYKWFLRVGSMDKLMPLPACVVHHVLAAMAGDALLQQSTLVTKYSQLCVADGAAEKVPHLAEFGSLWTCMPLR